MNGELILSSAQHPARVRPTTLTHIFTSQNRHQVGGRGAVSSTMVTTRESVRIWQRRSSSLFLGGDGGGRATVGDTLSSSRERFQQEQENILSSNVGATIRGSKSNPNIGGRKANLHNRRGVEPKSASIGDSIMLVRRGNASGEAEETWAEARGESGESVHSATGNLAAAAGATWTSATTGSASTKHHVAVGNYISHGTTAGPPTNRIDSNINTTTNIGGVGGSSSSSVPAAKSIDFAMPRPSSARGKTAENQNNLLSASSSLSASHQGLIRQREVSTGATDDPGVRGSGAWRRGTRQQREEQADEKTAATRIGNVLAALPLSKLKIVIGKFNCCF